MADTVVERRAPRASRTSAAVAAVCLLEGVVLVASASSDVRPSSEGHEIWATTTTTLALVGALVLVGSALLLQATRTTRPGVSDRAASPAAVLVGVAAYVAITPLARLVLPDDTAWILARSLQAIGLVALVCLVLGASRRSVCLGVLVLAGFLVLTGPTALRALEDTTHLGAAVVHLLTEASFAVGWSVLALCLAWRTDRGPHPALALPLVLLLGPMHVLRAIDGAVIGASTACAAALLVMAAAAVLHHSWAATRRETVAVVAARSRLEGELGHARSAVDRHAQRQEEIAHDARNACAAVRIAVDLLCADDTKLDPATFQLLRRAVVGGVEQLEHLMVDADEPAVEFDVLEVLGTAVEGRRLRGTQIQVDAPKRAVIASGRPGDVSTAVQNLLVNAERHAPGSVVRISAVRLVDEVLLTVSDCGPGVPDPRRDDLFDRGARGDGGGQGLGLYIARSLVRAQGGDLTLVASAAGACFELRLPAAAAWSPTRPRVSAVAG